MCGTYNNEQYDVEWIPNNTTSNLNAFTTNVEEILLSQRKRSESVPTGDNVHYNDGDVESSDNKFSFSGRSETDIFSSKDELLADVPVNRITYLDCKYLDPDQCVRGKFIETNFKSADAVISITLNFTIDMETVGKALDDKHDFLVIKSFADLIRTSANNKFVLLN